MDKKVFFEDARRNVLDFFSMEFPNIQISEIDQIVSLFYKLVNYEEEGKKIRPTILITSNINHVAKQLDNAKKITFYEDPDMSNFKARIKALMLFCKSDWSIYFNYGEGVIEYGIIKKLVSIKEQPLMQSIKQKSTLDTIAKRGNLIVLNVYGGGFCELVGARGNKCRICFNLNSRSEYEWDSQISEFVDACISKIKTTQKKLSDIKILITNIFHRVLHDSHGTICMIIDKDYVDKTGFLSDGTWLKEPIEFGKMFLRSSKFDENVLRSYADVLTTMLDFDGITVLDNAGRIRAYNVFIEASQDKKNKIVGGARRRAAYSILSNKSKKIIGVYFQSQDGDNFYKERSDLKKKKPSVKIVGGEVVNENEEMLPLEIIAKLNLQQKKEEQEKLQQEKSKAEQEKLKAQQEKLKAEQEKLKAEQEKIKAEQERIKAEHEKIEKQREEQERLKAEHEKSEQERLVREEQQRFEQEKQEQERAQQEHLEKESSENASVEQETTNNESENIEASQENNNNTNNNTESN